MPPKIHRGMTRARFSRMNHGMSTFFQPNRCLRLMSQKNILARMIHSRSLTSPATSIMAPPLLSLEATAGLTARSFLDGRLRHGGRRDTDDFD